MPRLFEVCQAWIERGQESWKSYFSKWESFATFETTLTEDELVHKLINKPKERRNGSKNMLKQHLSQKRLKTVFFKSQQRRRKKIIKRKKSCQKTKAEIGNQMLRRSTGNENLTDIIENKQLEITSTTVLSDFLKADTNMSKIFPVLFQTSTSRQMTVKDPDYLFPEQQMLPPENLETNVASPSFAKQCLSSLSVPGNNLHARSICPARDFFLQNLNDVNQKKIHSKQMQSESPGFEAQDSSMLNRCSFSKQKFLTSPTPLLEPNLEVKHYSPSRSSMFGYKNAVSKTVQFEFSPKFCQNGEYSRNAAVSKMSTTQEYIRPGNLCLQQETNSTSLSVGTTNFITSRYPNEVLSQRRHPSKKLTFDMKEDDSDSDDQTEHRSPLIHCQNKGLKPDEAVVEALESDTDDCQCIFDRIVKS